MVAVRAPGRSIAASALLLFTGAAIGVAIDHLVIFHRHAAAANAATSSIAANHGKLLAALDTLLRLTPPQHDSIAALLTRHQQSIDSAWRLIHRHLDAGMDSVHHELRTILTPDQLKALGTWMQQQAMRMHD